MKKDKLSKIAESCGIPSKTENSIESALKNASKENGNAINRSKKEPTPRTITGLLKADAKSSAFI